MPSKVTVAPATEPLTSTEVKLHLKVDYTTDDDLITDLIQAAREVCEDYLNRKLITQTVQETFPCFPMEARNSPYAQLRLTWSPLISVSTVEYQASAGTYTELSSDNYTVADYQVPAVIMPAYNSTWPTAIEYPDAVRVTYTAGYADADSVPAGIKSAMLLMIGHWYDNRQDTVRRMPTQAEWLLHRYRVKVF